MSSTRESELTLINYIIRCPAIYKENESNLKMFPFEYPYSRDIYKIVVHPIKRHGTAPTHVEAKRLANEYSDKKGHTSIQRSKLQDDLDYTYMTASSAASGDVFTNYVFAQGARELANKLLVSSPEDFKKHYFDLKNKLDSLSSLGDTEEESLGVSLMYGDDINSCIGLMKKANLANCIATGFPGWDNMLQGGYRPGEVAMIMASTGLGKTSLCLNIAFNNAVDFNKRVVYITMDNQVEEVAQRFFCRWLDKTIDSTTDYEDTFQELTSKVEAGKEHNFILQTWLPQKYKPGDVIKYVKKLQERLKIYDLDHGVPIEECGHVDLIILDYLEKMLPDQPQELYRQALFQIADGCVVVAKTFACPVILASQSNKESMKSETAQVWQAGESYAKLHPCAHVCIMSMTDEERLSTPARFRVINGKNRRPETNYCVPMIFDKYTQCIKEDPDRPIIALNSTLKTDAGASVMGQDWAEKQAANAAEVAGLWKHRTDKSKADSVGGVTHTLPYDPVTGVILEETGRAAW